MLDRRVHALCSNIMPVKRRPIYILNVVVKQEILIKTGKQNTRRIVVLHATEFHSLQKYQSHDKKTSLYTTVTVSKLVTKKRMFCGRYSSQHRHVQLSVSKDVGDSGPWDEQHTISASMYRRLTCRTTYRDYRVPLQ